MQDNKTPVKKSATDKEGILETITTQLLNGLTILREQLGEKKYEKRIKKAAKLLVEGIKKTTPKKPVAAVEKAAPKKEKATKRAAAIKVTKDKTAAKIPAVKKVETVIKIKTKK